MNQNRSDAARPKKNNFLVLLPFFLLLAGEISAYLYLALSGKIVFSHYSVIISAFLFTSGAIPALLKPGKESVLAACLIALISGLTFTPLDQNLLPAQAFNGSIIPLTMFMILRLAIGTLIPPISLHIASSYPRVTSLPRAIIPLAYTASLTLWALFLLFYNSPAAKTLFFLAFSWFFIILFSALGLLVKNAFVRNVKDIENSQQSRILLILITLSLTPLLLRPIIFFLSGWAIPFNIILTSVIFWPIGLGIISFRHDIFGIDSFLRRAFAYSVLSLIVLLLYLGLTLALNGILSNLLPGFSRFATIISLLIAAALFEPIRKKTQFAIDHFLYPDRVNFQKAMILSGQALSRVNNIEDIYQELRVNLPKALGAQWAVLTIVPEPETPGPQKSKPAWSGRLQIGERVLGRYWLGPRQTIQTYDRDEQVRLQSILQQSALAMAYAETIEELNQLNAELENRVEIRSRQIVGQQRQLLVLEERRRLAREMHDSVSQALFSIHLSTRALKNLARKDIETTISELGELEKTSQQAITDMRSLLNTLRNPEQPIDLIQEIRRHCDHLANNMQFTVLLEIPENIILDAKTAHEIIQIIKEALHNSLKHSGVNEAVCRITQTEKQLTIQISDQGRGFNPQQIQEGHYGIKGIEERTAAMDGNLLIKSESGQGTLLKIKIPLKENENI